MKIHEECGCGASIDVTDDWAVSVRRTVEGWRTDHQRDTRSTADEAPEQRGTSAAQIEIGFQQREDTVMARG